MDHCYVSLVPAPCSCRLGLRCLQLAGKKSYAHASMWGALLSGTSMGQVRSWVLYGGLFQATCVCGRRASIFRIIGQCCIDFPAAAPVLACSGAPFRGVRVRLKRCWNACSTPDQLALASARLFLCSTLPALQNPVSYFALQIINTDAEKTASVTFASNITNNTASLVMAEQVAAATIFNTCCNDANSCAAWKAVNKANSVAVYSDLCHLSGQICDSDGAQRVGRQDVLFAKSFMTLYACCSPLLCNQGAAC